MSRVKAMIAPGTTRVQCVHHSVQILKERIRKLHLLSKSLKEANILQVYI